MKTIFTLLMGIGFVCLGFQDPPTAQPHEQSKCFIGDFLLMQDYKRAHVWYYLPTQLTLAKNNDGQPAFSLLQMRHLGTRSTGNAGEKHFMSLVQLTLEREEADAKSIEQFQNVLGKNKNIRFEPMPESHAEIQLFLPAENNGGGQYKLLGSAGKGGSKGVVWTERTFTIRLRNHEAQLLQKQLTENKLAISVSYSFHGEVVPGKVGDYKVSGDSAAVAAFGAVFSEGEEGNLIDTLLQPTMFYGNTFRLDPDLNRWPELVKQIDINESIPPVYAAFELRCYDFSNNLRPDLSMKTVEIEARGLDRKPIKQKLKFMRAKAQEDAHYFHFPFPVRMDKPFRYKVKEYNLDGEITKETRASSDTWGGVLDITSDLLVLGMEQTTVEVELDLDLMKQAQIQAARVDFQYYLNDELRTKSLIFDLDNQIPIQEAAFFYQKTQPLQYRIIWQPKSGKTIKEEFKKMGQDDYLFLSPNGGVDFSR